MYIFVYPVLWLVSILPMPVMYLFSDVAYFFVRYVVRYRYNVVARNIRNSFPEKTDKERRKIIREFYHHLCDYAFESIALWHISERSIKKRFVFTNPELLISEEVKHKNMVALFGHYGNWEWVSALPLWNDKINVATLYKPLRNKFFNRFFLNLRSRFGTICIDKNRVLREMLKLSKEPKPYVVAFIADQTPSINNIHCWDTFLNQETAMLTGWDTIARKTNNALVFLDVNKVKRGHYVSTIHVISTDPANCEESELMRQYITLMEKTISRNPAYWLWSHNRWKHKKN